MRHPVRPVEEEVISELEGEQPEHQPTVPVERARQQPSRQQLAYGSDGRWSCHQRDSRQTALGEYSPPAVQLGSAGVVDERIERGGAQRSAGERAGRAGVHDPVEGGHEPRDYQNAAVDCDVLSRAPQAERELRALRSRGHHAAMSSPPRCLSVVSTTAPSCFLSEIGWRTNNLRTGVFVR
eukprot:scaffold41322_cov60-Phaeocystis_antarctica.AAC.9